MVSKAALASVLLHVVTPLVASGALLAWLSPTVKEPHSIPTFEVQARLAVEESTSQEVPELEIVPPHISEPQLNSTLLEDAFIEPILEPLTTLSVRPESGTVEATQDPDACPPPDYPRSASRQRHQGQVLLWVDISADGSVVALGVKVSSGYASLDQAALSGVAKWRFNPARRFNIPCASTTTVLTTFVYEG